MAQHYGLMMDTPYIQHLISLGVDKGVEQGIAQGRNAAEQEIRYELRDNILDLSGNRFEQVNFTMLSKKLEGFDISMLLRILKQAAISENLTSFLAWLELQQEGKTPQEHDGIT